MRAKILVFGMIGLLLILLPGGIREARADIPLWGDKLTLTGFLRYELAVHTAQKNPNNFYQTDNNDFNFSRTYFQTEWTYKPSNIFKLYAKVKLMGDQTREMDDALGSYKAFPVDVPRYDWMMMKGSTNQFRAEVNELYADLNFGDLWLRLGKQQIAWGEMLATRILDVINPLDMSRNLLFELEEFENIRIPEWSIRGRYQFGKVGPVDEFMLEGFVNPRDVQPTQYADFGSPFYLGTGNESFPPFFRLKDKDRRGDTEFGFRMGGMLKSFYFTLNYLRLYSDEFLLEFTGSRLNPMSPIGVDLLFDKKYPLTNIFGLTANYCNAPTNTVATFEGAWIPDQPYQDAWAYSHGDSKIHDQGTWNYAIRFDRQTFVFPRPTSAMMITFQYSQTVREGDNDRILGANNSKVDKTDDFITLKLDQNFYHDTYVATLLFVYDTDDASYFKPSFKYRHGDRWYIDLYTVYLAGKEKRPGRFGGLDWVNETVVRFTYQF